MKKMSLFYSIYKQQHGTAIRELWIARDFQPVKIKKVLENQGLFWAEMERSSRRFAASHLANIVALRPSGAMLLICSLVRLRFLRHRRRSAHSLSRALVFQSPRYANRKATQLGWLFYWRRWGDSSHVHNTDSAPNTLIL